MLWHFTDDTGHMILCITILVCLLVVAVVYLIQGCIKFKHWLEEIKNEIDPK